MRRALTAAAVAALATTAQPATAAVLLPACSARLVASAGSHYCETWNAAAGRGSSGGFFRTANVAVATGSVTATLTCWTSWRTHSVSRTVAAGGTAHFGTWDEQSCRLSLQANVAGTTAVGTSTPSYVVDPE